MVSIGDNSFRLGQTNSDVFRFVMQLVKEITHHYIWLALVGVRGKTRNRKVSYGLYLTKRHLNVILSLIGLGNSWQLNIAPQGLIGM